MPRSSTMTSQEDLRQRRRIRAQPPSNRQIEGQRRQCPQGKADEDFCLNPAGGSQTGSVLQQFGHRHLRRERREWRSKRRRRGNEDTQPDDSAQTPATRPSVRQVSLSLRKSGTSTPQQRGAGLAPQKAAAIALLPAAARGARSSASAASRFDGRGQNISQIARGRG